MFTFRQSLLDLTRTGIGNWVRKIVVCMILLWGLWLTIFSQVMMEAAIGISVFLDDRVSYDQAMTKFLGRVPAYIYLTSDGPYPKTAPASGLTTLSIKAYWHNQQTYPENGIAQETCRDFVHTSYGIASIGHIAENSGIQGTDLYSTEIGTRLRYALGFHSKLELGNSIPSWLCNGSVKRGLGPSKFWKFSFLVLSALFSLPFIMFSRPFPPTPTPK